VRRGDKAVRAQSMRGRMAMLGLYVWQAPWVADFRPELLSSPAGRHDDQVDALGLVGQLLDRVSASQKPKPPEVAHQDAYRLASDEMPDASSSVKLLRGLNRHCCSFSRDRIARRSKILQPAVHNDGPSRSGLLASCD
jgi:hypothetical protein